MKVLQDIQDYLRTSIDKPNLELEYIYGESYRDTLSRDTFLRLLSYLKINYTFVDESNTLDIRKETISRGKRRMSTIRCTIEGIHNIQSYCKTETMKEELYIQKSNVPDKPVLLDSEYNYRIQLKREEPLRKDHPDVKSFLVDLSQSNKHYRYKKRYSFNTSDNLFRVDVTVVKSSPYNPTLKRYDLKRTFRESNLLKQPESYELEVEYLGTNTPQGIKQLVYFQNQVEPEVGTKFQPLDPSKSYQETSKDTTEDVQTIVGEYVIIKDDFLQTLDKSLAKQLRGKPVGYVMDLMVIGELTYAMIDIPDNEQLIVPITEVYNESWDSGNTVSEFKPNVTSKLLEEIQSRFNDTVFDLLCQIQQTKVILSKSTTEQIVKDYAKLTGQAKRKRPAFMAPQPVTLTMFHLDSQNPIHILNEYAVTEKADGQRYLLYIHKSKRGYLLDTKLGVIDTGCEFPECNGEWILDGEYIRSDKRGNPIQLYMIFDIYYAEKTIESYPYKLPFWSDQGKSREQLLTLFQTDYVSKKKVIVPDFQPLRIFQKVYEYTPSSSSSILLHSKRILQKQELGGFEYEIDGLIYLPLRLPVKGESDGTIQGTIQGAWNHNFKWKPPEENTIDFRVITVKDTTKKYIRDKQYPIRVEDGEGNSTVEYYKTVKLVVSYDAVKDPTLNYPLMIVDNTKRQDISEIQFQPPDAEVNYGVSKIRLVDGKMICEKDKREFRDTDIVEMRYEESEDGFQWVPLRVRSDKTSPQWFLAANNVWCTIQTPVSKDMISGNINLDTIHDHLPDSIETCLYYVNETDRKTSDSLRKFHNFIKYCLITGICYGKQVSIMDTSIGRGGDIRKYIQKHFHCDFLFGLDLNSVNEASRRYYYMNHKKRNAVFIRYNTAKNIVDKEGYLNQQPEFSEQDIVHSESMINILYGMGSEIPKTYKPIRQRYNKLALKKFDVLSCQFSLHYYFESVDTFNGFLSNIKDNVKRGGYFIGTCYDGQRLFDALEINPTLRYQDDFGNLVYQIDKRYDITSFEESLFGNKIDVYMDSIGDTYSEYLVNFKEFVKIMKDNGFELTKPTFRKDFDLFEGPLNGFDTILRKLPSLTSNKEFNHYYQESLRLMDQEELSFISSLNNYFIFQRV